MGRHVDFLPLGSVIRIKGTKDKDYIICQRCAFAKTKKDKKYQLYDYGIIRYPLGVVNNRAFFINTDEIGEVLFKGYVDDDERKIERIMSKYVAENDEYKLSVWDQINPFS